MARPSKVQVAHISYDIVWLDEDDWMMARHPSDAQAVTESDKALITMRSNCEEMFLRETLLHELMHACFNLCQILEYAPKDRHDQEEFYIRNLSPTLFNVLSRKENVRVRDYLVGL